MAQETFAKEALPGATTSTGRKAPPRPLDKRGPLAAVVAVAIFVVITVTSKPAAEGSALPWTLNPTGYLGFLSFLFLYVVTIPAKEVLTAILNFLGTYIFAFRKMDGESTNKLEVLENIDICYLAFNTIVEFVGMNHIAAFLFKAPMDNRLGDFGVFNGPVAFFMCMCVNDIIYYPFHCVAHKRVFYPYVHKQHHRQFVPFRGYYDAANQNPVEQGYGFGIFLVALHITLKTTGLHLGTAWVCALSWAILNISNHLPFDSSVHLPLPYPAFPRDHQMHHRIPTCNYSTLTTMMDRFFGSYKPFKMLGESSAGAPTVTKAWFQNREIFHDDGEDSKEPVAEGRPEAFPSAWSVVGLFFALITAVLVAEIFYLGGLPHASNFFHFFKVFMVCLNSAVVCGAVESAGSKAPSKKKWRRQDGRPSGIQEALKEADPVPGVGAKTLGNKKIFKETWEPERAKPFKRE
jgi:sterol desaturase/sphingolipid hydroxylase (fatty acid hydroxylase superfamily)